MRKREALRQLAAEKKARRENGEYLSEIIQNLTTELAEAEWRTDSKPPFPMGAKVRGIGATRVLTVTGWDFYPSWGKWFVRVETGKVDEEGEREYALMHPWELELVTYDAGRAEALREAREAVAALAPTWAVKFYVPRPSNGEWIGCNGAHEEVDILAAIDALAARQAPEPLGEEASDD